MSKIHKAPSVQLNSGSFLVNNAPPVFFNEELSQPKRSITNDFNQNLSEYEDIDDEIDFGEVDFEKQEFNRLNNSNFVSEELQQEADDIISEANKLAESILDEAKSEAELFKDRVIAESKEEGFNLGYSEGNEKAQAENEEILNEKLQEIEDEKNLLFNERENLMINVETELTEVIGSVVESILGSAFSVDKNLIVQMIKLGLKQSTLNDNVTIKVSNDLLEIVNENIELIKTEVPRNIGLEIVTDKNLENSECIIESNLGYIKCDVDSIIESIKFNLKSIFHNF